MDRDKELGFYLEGLMSEECSTQELHEQFCILGYWFAGGGSGGSEARLEPIAIVYLILTFL